MCARRKTDRLTPFQLVVTFFLLLIAVGVLLWGFVAIQGSLTGQASKQVYFVVLVVVGLLAGVMAVGILKGAAKVGGGDVAIDWLKLTKVEANGAVAVMIIVILLGWWFTRPEKKWDMTISLLRVDGSSMASELPEDALVDWAWKGKEFNGPRRVVDGRVTFKMTGDEGDSIDLKPGFILPGWQLANEHGWTANPSVQLKFERRTQCRNMECLLLNAHTGAPLSGKIVRIGLRLSAPSNKDGIIQHNLEEGEINDTVELQDPSTGANMWIKPCSATRPIRFEIP